MVVLAIWRLARSGDARLALVALPLGAALAVAMGLAGRWPFTAWLLTIAVLCGPVALAYRVRSPAAWNVVLVFALSGIVAGYGVLDRALGTSPSYPADSETALLAALAGGAVMLAAYAWLYVRGLVRR